METKGGIWVGVTGPAGSVAMLENSVCGVCGFIWLMLILLEHLAGFAPSVEIQIWVWQIGQVNPNDCENALKKRGRGKSVSPAVASLREEVTSFSGESLREAGASLIKGVRGKIGVPRR